MTSIKTSRLRLDPLGAQHSADYAALIAQPEVYRYLSRAKEIAEDPQGQADRIIAMSVEQWTTRGLGPYAIFENDTDRFIGRGGLLWVSHSDDVEINYMLDPSAWGRGYATELARAFLIVGFEGHRLNKMIATTNPDNRPSRHVLDKVGFRMTGSKDLGGRIVEMHVISRDEWLANAKRA